MADESSWIKGSISDPVFAEKSSCIGIDIAKGGDHMVITLFQGGKPVMTLSDPCITIETDPLGRRYANINPDLLTPEQYQVMRRVIACLGPTPISLRASKEKPDV